MSRSMSETPPDHRHEKVSSPSRGPSLWIMLVGGVVIAVQIAVLGSVVNQQVERASARQAPPATLAVQVTSSAEPGASKLSP